MLVYQRDTLLTNRVSSRVKKKHPQSWSKMKRHRYGVPYNYLSPKNKIPENHTKTIYMSITAGQKAYRPKWDSTTNASTFNQEVPPRSVNILQLIEQDCDQKPPSVARLFQYQLHIFNEKTWAVLVGRLPMRPNLIQSDSWKTNEKGWWM